MEKEPSLKNALLSGTAILPVGDYANHIKTQISKKMKELRDTETKLFICNRLEDKSSFLTLYKDAMFAYVDGIVLCERFFLESAISYQEVSASIPNEEGLKLYSEFGEFLKTVDLDSSEVSSKTSEEIKKYESLLANAKSFEDVKLKLPYYQLSFGTKKRLLLKELSGLDDNMINLQSTLISEYLISFCRTMFMTSEKDYSLSLSLINTSEHIDMIASIRTF